MPQVREGVQRDGGPRGARRTRACEITDDKCPVTIDE
jgi:hypothetical protein